MVNTPSRRGSMGLWRPDDFMSPESNLDDYEFPTNKLRKTVAKGKTPLVLVSCGSFSPITFLHLRMIELAMDHCRVNTNYEVIGSYLSPVSSAYSKDASFRLLDWMSVLTQLSTEKQGLAAAHHRFNMAALATATTPNVCVDRWEVTTKTYTPTALVLKHFEEELENVQILNSDGEKQRVQVSLLSGADLMETMSAPGVWATEDLDIILGQYGLFCVERAGTDIDSAIGTCFEAGHVIELTRLGSLEKYRDNIHVIAPLIQNDVSSTKIRLFLKKSLSIRYLVPPEVIDYIDANKLYREETSTASPVQRSLDDKGKAVAVESSSS